MKTVDLREFKSQKEQKKQKQSEELIAALVNSINEVLPVIEETKYLPFLIGLIRSKKCMLLPSPVQPQCKDTFNMVVEFIEDLSEEFSSGLEGVIVIYMATVFEVKKEDNLKLEDISELKDYPKIEAIIASAKLKDGSIADICQHFKWEGDKVILTDRIDLNNGGKRGSSGFLDNIFEGGRKR